MQQDIFRRASLEIVDFHRYLTRTFNGELSGPSAHRLVGHALEFVYIAPNGSVTTFEGLQGAMSAWSGAQPGIEIEVENIVLRLAVADLCLVTYEEWQRRGTQRHGRLSTAVFRDDAHAPHGVVWLHLHESLLP